ncbi:tryptophan synthase beta subunit-like PLP-dependent enzyme [Calycina marina]|uniref:L-serine ammonia-lyase n=1 Tax=Calycina marina TaxID=1763456 RepID=A0A9P7Z2H8_9HELO|nr:tryptophan synthase beta subunit-like PLP-dependent enzyme [Calycina marina]
MGSTEKPLPPCWIETPCIRSAALSREAGCNIYLKLETLQPSASFKSRGIGHLMSRAVARNGSSKPIHFYCSSGGNAGLACATAAITLNRPTTICVPNSTSSTIVEKLRTLGAHVVVHGDHFAEADHFMREELMAKDANAVYVHPFDDAEVWEGHGTLVDELEKQMQGVGGYEGLVCSVGGGGMFTGIMQQLEKYGRLQGGSLSKRGIRILAMETNGAHSLNHSLENQKLSRLNGITSIATSLGATQVAERCFELASKPEVTSCVFSDAEAAMASVCFADDERMLVEPACGVSVAPAYNDTLAQLLFPELSTEDFSKLNVVIVLCGGSKATLQILEDYRETYGKDARVVKKFHARRLASEAKDAHIERID